MKQYLLIALLFLPLWAFAQSDPAQKAMDAGVAAYEKGGYPEAVEYFRQCVNLCKKHNSKLLGKAYNNLANTLSQTGKSDEALKNYLLSIAASKKIADSLNIAKTSKNIGTLYSEQKDFGTAMKYYDEALAYARQIKNPPLVADCLNNIGVIYEQQEKYGEALELYEEALGIYRTVNDEGRIAMTLNNLAIVYKYVQDYPRAIENYEASLALSQKLGDGFMLAANRNNLGNVYALTGNHKKGLELCLQALLDAEAIEANEVAIEACDGISSAYENLGQYKQALAYRKLYEQKKHDFINNERSAQLADMQVKYETQKKEGEIRELQNEKKIKELEILRQQLMIDKRNRFIIAFACIIAALLAIGYFWRGRQRLRQRLEAERLVRETEEQERLRIAKDIHDDLGSGLTKINFLSEVISQKTSALPEVKNNSDAVQETARRMIGNMRDLIWALNPENTTLAGLIARMREYISDYLEDQHANLQFSIPDSLPQDAISKESHRQLLMVVKEAFNNIAKHAQATHVRFSVRLGENLTIVIEDDGKGFTIGQNAGNGLRNIKARMESIGGSALTDSEPGRGTATTFSVPLANIHR